jgi:hypothetical protein
VAVGPGGATSCGVRMLVCGVFWRVRVNQRTHFPLTPTYFPFPFIERQMRTGDTIPNGHELYILLNFDNLIQTPLLNLVHIGKYH